jgi:hypothetical protein
LGIVQGQVDEVTSWVSVKSEIIPQNQHSTISQRRLSVEVLEQLEPLVAKV